MIFESDAASKDRQVFGWIEKVRIDPGKLVLQAKLDTGADNSSLCALILKEFDRGGIEWVRFEVTSYEGRKATLERPVIRRAKIKRFLGIGQERPVVRLGVCIGNIYREVDVNLVDRRRFKYEMLIGRSFMAGQIHVDPSSKFTQEPNCGEAATP